MRSGPGNHRRRCFGYRPCAFKGQSGAGIIEDGPAGGASDAADAFKAALKIPNLLQNLFGEGALSASFIPVPSLRTAAFRMCGAPRVPAGQYLPCLYRGLWKEFVTGFPDIRPKIHLAWLGEHIHRTKGEPGRSNEQDA